MESQTNIADTDLPFQGAILEPSEQDLPVDPDRILESFEMDRSQADEYLMDTIGQYTARCRELCEPLARYALFNNLDFAPGAGALTLDGVRFNLGEWVTGFLKKSTWIAVFLGTAGEQVEQLSKQLMQDGHLLEGYIVDLIGSELAEGVAVSVHHAIENNARQAGLNITNRYSPGYCHWPVSDQTQIFSLIGKDSCGIRLTRSSLMIPMKSVSGIIGVGKHVKQMGYKCRVCPDEKCIMREKNGNEGSETPVFLC
ncbi:MAG: hypothetical protein K9N46_11280 [Candidatus Marinimicrobia bacterium]|nr:hypothetical protein [Candidatus Neomarinimicrobiota bacterium]MCF7827635.1 hypothetical protein [Candidatus Neomarinimicrobiota bacterium]MCF7881310.1 hypothetical protein [Candidatus Neomarinimicrobiota bacterium]